MNSTDTQILRVIQELGEIRDHNFLSGNDNNKIRVRDFIQDSINDLQFVHDKTGEPNNSFEFRSAMASVVISLGYFHQAFLETEIVNGSTDPGLKESTLLNMAFQAISYLQNGIAILLVAIEENNEPATGVF